MTRLGTRTDQSGVGVHSQREIDSAWDSFLSAGGGVRDLSVRNLIALSWERCLSQGVDPQLHTAPILAPNEDALYTVKAKSNDLLECAQPILQQARVFLRDLETLLFMTDYRGINLEVVGAPQTIEAARGIGLVPGADWKEAASGSNAVGTAMATRKPTQVHGEEHFCQGFKPWTCTAAVIADPYDNQMIGSIDVSGLRSVFDRFHIPLVMAWAGEIQNALAKKTLEQWYIIQQYSNGNVGDFRRSEKLLFDLQGRLINSTKNSKSALDLLGMDYDPESKCRLSFERFGGEEILYPHNDGQWLPEDWVEPIVCKNELLGFQLHLPSNKLASRRIKKGGKSRLDTESRLDPFNNIVGVSASIKTSTDLARKAATTPLPVLLLGDTGVGKELFAKAIHESSDYADGPCIDLNCAGFASEILTSELFGHVEGAFTGAKKGGMKGKIEAANGGTLFLDEIGEMPLDIQPIFLRVLQERKIYRVGDIKPIFVDFRLIAATNRDLKRDVAEGRFRKDLYYRLATITINLDPLSARPEDIEGIAQVTLEKIQKSHAIVPRSFSPPLIKALRAIEWPGNIRELINVIECMSFMSQNETLTVDDLPDGYKLGEAGNCFIPDPGQTSWEPGSLDSAEQHVIESAIMQSGGNMTRAAKHLGIAKSTLYQKIKKYGLEKTG